MFMNGESKSIAQVFDEICLHSPENVALIFDDDVLLFKDLFNQVIHLATHLSNLGVKKNDRVAIILSNCKEYIITYFALFKIGVWAMPINTRWEEEEINNIFLDAKPCTVILEKQIGVIHYLDIIENVRKKYDFIKNVILLTKEEATNKDILTFNSLVKELQTKIEFDTVFPDDIAMLSYTSGTTGTPKGVMISHQNFYFTSLYTTKIWEMENEVPLSIAPLYAAQGFLAMLIDFISGGAMHFISTFNPNEILKAISSGKNSAIHTQPTMWSLLLTSRAINFAKFSSLRKVVVSGSLCSYHLAKSIEERVGCTLLNAYGLVEATSVVTLTSLTDSLEVRLNTVGKPIPGVSVKIVDENRNEVPKGKVGELAVKGYLMKGYYNKEELTKEVIDKEGWLYTGDLARYYDEENICIVGRCKDMIIRGGFNIYPIDIEEILLKHPSVQDAAVVGRTHEVVGEQTVAFVIPKPGTILSKIEMVNFCKGKIANYKIPDDVIFISQMPIILSGKVKKNTLKEWAVKGVPENELFLFQ